MENIYQIGELKKDLPQIKSGDTLRIFEKVVGDTKKKSQVFEGILISQKHGKGINATFTLRAIISGVGVEKTYPIHSPLIEKIEIIKKGKVRRAKLYYLRGITDKKIRKKLKSEVVSSAGKDTKKEIKKEEVKEGEKNEELNTSSEKSLKNSEKEKISEDKK